MANPDAERREQEIASLAERYCYEPWRVRIFDMQRSSVRMPHPPSSLLPCDLKEHYKYATLVFQANGFVFTTSETSSMNSRAVSFITPYSARGDCHCVKIGYNGCCLSDFSSAKLVEIMGKPSTFYFPFKDRETGHSIPTYLVLNPYEGCAYRCRACSRLPFLGKAGNDYEKNIGMTLEVLKRAINPEEVQFINIITGSMPTAEGDLELYKKVIESFSRAGFRSEYGVYTPNVKAPSQMEQLREMGVVFFTFTTEVTTPEARRKFYGMKNAKGRQPFEESVKVIKAAGEVFPYVNTNIMLGYERADELKRNLELLARETRATVNHFIPRIFTAGQAGLIHPSAQNLEYYVDLCSFVERKINSKRKPFGAFFEERYGIPKFGLRFRS